MMARPNIVFVLADDMDARMLDDLPRLRALTVERGLSFSSVYAAAPVCCPSRASLLRGQYPHNTGVLANGAPDGGIGAFRNRGLEASTIATWLQAVGYQTGLVGKYLNDYEKSLKHVAPGWNRWFVYGGKGKYRSWRVSDEGKIREYGKDKRRKQYQTDVLARKAVEFIHSAPAASPLFLFLAPSAPHEPASPAERHKKAAVARPQALRVPSFDEQDMDDKIALWRNRGPLSGKHIRAIDKVYVKQQKSMFSVEDMIDDVIAALEATSRLDNTYIIFASDNGYHHGEHRVGLDKNTPFEESTRVPLTIAGPGVPAGATSEAMVSLIDLAPTFAEWAGAAVPDFVDGRSLVPLLGGGTPGGWRDAVVSELLHGPNGGFTVLRQGSYVYTRYGNDERELYDLADDPFQLDAITASAPESLLSALQARIESFATCGEDGGSTCHEVDGGT